MHTLFPYFENRANLDEADLPGISGDRKAEPPSGLHGKEALYSPRESEAGASR